MFGPKVAVKGRVVTDHGGKDVAAYQALVTIGKAAPVETDYDGTFEVVGVKTGKQSVTIEKEGFETVTKTVDINADNADLGDLYIVPNEGATLTVEPEWILPLLSKSMEALENQTRPIDIKPDTVIAEATIDVVLEQDGGKRYTAGAKTRLVWTGFGVEAQSSGTLIIMGIEHEAGTGYTLTATGTAGSDYFDDSIVIQGEAKIAAEEFDDGKYVWDFAIDLSAFVEQRPQ
ncbi:MAG: carboxypeptidase-like regulatory domain-containing protein [Bacillota bacterium]